MAVYVITRFAASDMAKVEKMGEHMREELEGVGADFIDPMSELITYYVTISIVYRTHLLIYSFR